MKTEAEILEATEIFINFVESLTDEEIRKAGFCIILHVSTKSMERCRIKGTESDVKSALDTIFNANLE